MYSRLFTQYVVFILFILLPFTIFSNQAKEREQNISNIIAVSDTLSKDSVSNVVIGKFKDVINEDSKIIESLVSKNDSIQKAINLKKVEDEKAMAKHKSMFLYIAIGAGILFILIISLLLASSFKAKKLKKIVAEKDSMLEFKRSELNNQSSTVELLNKEKTALEKEIIASHENSKMLQQKVETLKDEAELLTTEKNQLLLQNNQLIQKISEAEKSISLIENDLNVSKSNYKIILKTKDESISNLVRQKTELEEKVKSFNIQLEQFKEQIAEESKSRDKIEKELENFVNELKTMLPLPKK